MSVTDLKVILHKQIDLVEREEDLHDLLLTVSEFVNHRVQPQAESFAFLEQLQHSLNLVANGHVTSHSHVVDESKQWITP